MTRKAQNLLRAALLLIVSGIAAPLYAQQDCFETEFERAPGFLIGPDCTISWIDNNQLKTITWHAVLDDFWSPSLEQTTKGAMLTSSDLPDLIDVDQDGWQDIVTFTRVGKVNGVFNVFFYNPEIDAFGSAQPLSGHTIERDRDGYIVATGRNGPGQLLRFYSIVKQDFTFQFEINPFSPKPSQSDQEFNCDVSAISSNGANETVIEGTVPQDIELLRYYCDTDSAMDRERRSIELLERGATTDRVPTQTVFYCRLEGGTHGVTISLTPDGMKYAYGSIGRDRTELVLERAMDQLVVLPENGAGDHRFGEILFTNGPFTYIATYFYSVFDVNGALLPSDPDNQSVNPTFQRRLRVLKDGDTANPVFDKGCLLEHSFDEIFMLEPH